MKGIFHNLTKSYNQHRYAILFYSLLVSLVAVPLFSVLHLGRNLIEMFFTVNLVAAVIPIRSGNTRHLLLSVLVLLWVTKFGASSFHQDKISAGSLAILIVVALLAAMYAIRFAFRSTSIGGAQIYAALSAYMLGGMFFGHFYWVIEKIWSGSLLYASSGNGDLSIASAVYFSFVTLATLGYGDIVPRTDLVRGLAVLEAVAGQFYLAIMIARLVSLHSSKRNADWQSQDRTPANTDRSEQTITSDPLRG